MDIATFVFDLGEPKIDFGNYAGDVEAFSVWFMRVKEVLGFRGIRERKLSESSRCFRFGDAGR